MSATAQEILTECGLIELRQAKDAAQAKWEEANRVARDAAAGGYCLETLVKLDIARHAALKASCAADLAYSNALTAYLDGKRSQVVGFPPPTHAELVDELELAGAGGMK